MIFVAAAVLNLRLFFDVAVVGSETLLGTYALDSGFQRLEQVAIIISIRSDELQQLKPIVEVCQEEHGIHYFECKIYTTTELEPKYSTY